MWTLTKSLVILVSLLVATVASGCTLQVPDGLHFHVSENGQASNGDCPFGCAGSINYYYAPIREIVLVPHQGAVTVAHEYCHAHQHWSINGGAELLPSDYDLESWYETGEGRSFTAAVAGEPWPWTLSAVNGLEDFAWTCANWYIDPTHLLDISPVRYAWARENLP